MAIWGPLKQQYAAMMRRYTSDELRFVLDFMRSGEAIGWRLVDDLREQG